MCLNVKAFGAVAELHPYRVTWRNVAIALTTPGIGSPLGGLSANLTLPDYGRVARDPAKQPKGQNLLHILDDLAALHYKKRRFPFL